MKQLFYTLALGTLVLLSASCQKESITQANALRLVGNSTESSEGNAEMRSPKKGSKSIAEIAIANNFDELVKALSYVDSAEGTTLVDLFLNGTDQYTVFAPTNAAFDTLYSQQGVNGITDLPSSLVLNVLYYHVTEGRRGANSVVPKKNSRTIETLLEESFKVNSDLSIDAIGNTANIIGADISASNGIIHVIDRVILPIK